MKILNLISSSGLFGAERVAIELASSLKQTYGHTPVMGIIKNSHDPHTEVADEAGKLGIESVVFPCSGRFSPGVVKDIRAFIMANGIDVVHSHGYKSNFYALFASRGLAPSIATNHNWLRPNWKLKLYCFIDSLLIRRFDHIVGVSEAIRVDMTNHGVPDAKITVIDNGVDMRRFERMADDEKIRSSLGVGPSTRLIGTIGNLKVVKGHTYLLKAAKEVLENTDEDLRFVFVGDGTLRADLEAEARNLGIDDKVIFTGYRSDVEEILKTLDVFVMSSLNEGLPMVLLEAMASKKPVVATRVGAIPKVVEESGCGLLVEPGNAHALADALATLSSDTVTMRRFGENGYAKVMAEYSSDKMADKYLEVYNGIIAKKKYIKAAVAGTSHGSGSLKSVRPAASASSREKEVNKKPASPEKRANATNKKLRVIK